MENNFSPSEWKKERDQQKKERRELLAVVFFGILVVGYFGAHLVAYLIATKLCV